MFTLSNEAVALLDGCVAWSRMASVIIGTKKNHTELELNKFTLYVLFSVRYSGTKTWKKIDNVLFNIWVNNI